MSRELLILRHAKSDWNTSYGPDRERPLAPRGIAAAGLMGRYAAEVGAIPDLVLSSPAVRARRTAELAVEGGHWNVPIEIRDEFYGGGGEAVLQCLQVVDPVIHRVAIVGHEPVWSSLVAGFSGGGYIRFPTAALACLSVEAELWSELGWGLMDLRWMVTPKELKRSGFGD